MTQKGNEKFDQKPNRGFQIRTQKRETLSPSGNKFTIFFLCVCWYGNHHSVFAQTFFPGPSVSQNEAPVERFGSGNLPFRVNKSIEFWKFDHSCLRNA